MDDIMKIVTSFKDLFIIGVTITTESETREKTSQFFSLLLGKLGVNLLVNMLAD